MEIELIRNRVIEKYLNKVLHRGRIIKMIIVSPWISDFRISTSFGNIDLQGLCRILKNYNSIVYIVTRRPIEIWHKDAINIIENEKNIGKVKINLKYNSNVHAKILFTYSDQLQSGLIGSANLTDRSLKNDEIGVYIPKTEKTRKLVKDMQVSAMNIYHNSR
jgi:phosphatidylserine/phosphatidylglycerophosphate/cardiolipin synthase-like enzyme